MKVVQNRYLRWFLFGVGCVAVILGVIGIFVPLLPTTPFLLLAAWSFVRSSPEAHQWMYRQPALGAALRDWEERGAISKRTKVIATSMILASIAVLWFKNLMLPVQLGLTLMLLTVTGFILTRPSH